MNGVCLRFYTHENRKVHGTLFYEWLLDQAKALGIHGGTAYKAMAGYGRNGIRHESRFFELAGDLTVAVEFIVSDPEATRLLHAVEASRISVFYAKVPAEFGLVDGSDSATP